MNRAVAFLGLDPGSWTKCFDAPCEDTIIPSHKWMMGNGDTLPWCQYCKAVALVDIGDAPEPSSVPLDQSPKCAHGRPEHGPRCPLCPCDALQWRGAHTWYEDAPHKGVQWCIDCKAVRPIPDRAKLILGDAPGDQYCGHGVNTRSLIGCTECQCPEHANGTHEVAERSYECIHCGVDTSK